MQRSKLWNRHISAAWGPGRMIQFFINRSMSHVRIMYTAKMCHNSLLNDHIRFMLGWLHVSSPTTIGVQSACHSNVGCLAMGQRILGFVTMYFSIVNILDWCTCSPWDPSYVTEVTLADTQGALVTLLSDCAYVSTSWYLIKTANIIQKKNCIQSIQYWAVTLKRQKLNVVNYKHETHQVNTHCHQSSLNRIKTCH